MFDQFLLYLGAKRSKATVSSYRYALRSLQEFLERVGKRVEECTLIDLTDYLTGLEHRGLRSGTRNLYATALRTLWAWLYQQGKVPFSEKLIPVPQIIDQEPYPFLTEPEYQAILESFSNIRIADVRDKCLVAVLWDTGVRIGECLSINVGDLDLSKMEGEVKTFKRLNHRRTIFWTKETGLILARWLEYRKEILKDAGTSCEALFVSLNPSSTPDRLDKCNAQRMLRETRMRIGLEKKITAHSFRHGFGARAVKNKANLRYLQVMMGHAKITTTEHYMGWRQEDVAQEYRAVMAPRLTPQLQISTLLEKDYEPTEQKAR